MRTDRQPETKFEQEPREMDAEAFDQALIEALWGQLHSTHTPPPDEVLEGSGTQLDKGSRRGTSVHRYTSSVTGKPVYVQGAGGTIYLHGDEETIAYVHEASGPPKESQQKKMKAQAEGRDTYEVELGDTGTMKTYSAGSSPRGTTSEEYWAFWCEKLGHATDCELSPPVGKGIDLERLLDERAEVPDHQWRPKEEGEAIARRVEETVRDLVGGEHTGRIRVEFSTSYHGSGFSIWAGQAAWGIGDRNAPEEEVLENAKRLIEGQTGTFRHYADPAPARGSTGEPWFQEEG